MGPITLRVVLPMIHPMISVQLRLMKIVLLEIVCQTGHPIIFTRAFYRICHCLNCMSGGVFHTKRKPLNKTNQSIWGNADLFLIQRILLCDENIGDSDIETAIMAREIKDVYLNCTWKWYIANVLNKWWRIVKNESSSIILNVIYIHIVAS